MAADTDSDTTAVAITATEDEVTSEVTSEIADEEITRLMAEAAARNAALAQSNKHDVKRVAETFSKLTVALAERNRTLDYARLRADCEAGAVAQIMVAKGLVSEEEMQVRVYMLANRIVAEALQRAEEEALKSKLFVPGRP